ncbi:SDR family oxidoreductase [Nocardia altamirensis]|uniref:SDR family oxidoreductase n=1 Tax=Nocardia altamirensis TaxID=472158 RepID=UPI0008405E9F|nr:NAD(P)H-binding protein [Nocardia altamirensis]
MAINTVLVIGATGHVGGQVVSQLSATGITVRALARNPAAAALPTGVEVVPGDLTAPATLIPALDGVDAVYLTWPMLSGDVAKAVVDVIAERTGRLVLLSSGAVRDDRDDQDNAIGAAHAAIEAPIKASGLGWTFLRPHAFATNTLEWASQIRTGNIVRGGYGAAMMTLVHEADIAAVAVRALTTDGHVGVSYELTGSPALSRIDQVATIGAALGRPLEWAELPPEQAKQYMDWVPRDAVDAVLEAFAALVDTPGQPTSTIQDVTGSPARTYAQWVADHVADFA